MKNTLNSSISSVTGDLSKTDSIVNCVVISVCKNGT